MAELVGNCLIGQSGGPTAVVNASVAGAITEALNHECIEEIYGCLNGVLGILNEEFIDLADESQQTIRALRYTPGAALGTCRYKIKKQQAKHEKKKSAIEKKYGQIEGFKKKKETKDGKFTIYP